MKKIVLSSIVILNLVGTSSAFAGVTRGDLKSAVSHCAKQLAQQLVDQLATHSDFKFVQNSPEVEIRESGVSRYEVTFSNYVPTVSDRSYFSTKSTQKTFTMNGSPFEISLNLSANDLEQSETGSSETESNNSVISLVSTYSFPTITFQSSSIVEVPDRFGRPNHHLDLISIYHISGSDYESRLKNKVTNRDTHFSLDYSKYRACLKEYLENAEKQRTFSK